jgi:hypothetical protein
MTTRRYYRRGQVVEVEEIDGLRATLAAPDTDLDFFPLGPDTEGGANIDADAAGLPEFAAFQEAGWRLRQTFPQSEHDDLHLASPEDAPGQRVYRTDDGSVAVGSNRLVVRLSDDMTPEAVRDWTANRRLEVLRHLPFAPNIVQVLVPTASHELELARQLGEDPQVLYAEPEFIREIGQRWTPPDPEFRRQWQWGPSNDGGVDLQAAWTTARGRGITIGVIDRGFDLSSPELEPGVLPLSGAYVSTWGGNVDFRPAEDLDPFPSDSHGTFCAGIAAGQSNAVLGVGAAPCANLALVSCLFRKVGTELTLALAIGYLATPSAEGMSGPGADVIVCSLGPNGGKWHIGSVLANALDFAASAGRGGKGTLIVWATSNGHQRVSDDEVCTHPKVFAVGRSRRSNESDRSAFGPGLDMLAPGVKVFGVVRGSKGGFETGTSFAAPVVAGIAALLLERAPHLTADSLRRILEGSADKIGPDPYDATGWNAQCGYGKVNAGRALVALPMSAAAATPAC